MPGKPRSRQRIQRIQRIRTQLQILPEALAAIQKLIRADRLVDFWSTSLDTEMAERVQQNKLPADWKTSIYQNLDPDDSKWDPFNSVNSVSDKEKFLNCANLFVRSMFGAFAKRDPSHSLSFRNSKALSYKKIYEKSERHVPKYRILLSDEIVAHYKQVFAEKQYTRIVIPLQVLDRNDTVEVEFFLVFYRNLLPDTIVVEIYHPELAEGYYDDHPVVEHLTENIVEFIGTALGLKTDVVVGLIASDDTAKELLEYMPFLDEEHYNTIPDHLFSMMWNLYLFLNRVQDPRYTYAELERVTNSFSRIDPDVRSDIYLEFLQFLLRFRLMMFYSKCLA